MRITDIDVPVEKLLNDCSVINDSSVDFRVWMNPGGASARGSLEIGRSRKEYIKPLPGSNTAISKPSCRAHTSLFHTTYSQ